MTKFESKIKTIGANAAPVFRFFSDMSNFRQVLPPDKIQNFSADSDSCSFGMSPLGQTKLKIVEKEEFKTIKLAGSGKTDFNLWFQFKQVAENDTRIKITFGAELNPMVKGMVQRPLSNFLNDLAEKSTAISY